MQINEVLTFLQDNGVKISRVNHTYKIPNNLELMIDTPNGMVRINSVVVKEDFFIKITLAKAGDIEVAARHRLIDQQGKARMAIVLQPGDIVKTKTGTDEIIAVSDLGEIAKFYDFGIESSDMIYADTNGLLHHNTFTVEKALADAGRSEGNGYTMVKGSGSALGLYRLLYNNRGPNDIILIDDADGLFSDQDQRNLFKAATDTKKVRTLSWIKASPGVYDPNSAKGKIIEQAKEMLRRTGMNQPIWSEDEDEDELAMDDEEDNLEGSDKEKEAWRSVKDPEDKVPNRFQFEGKIMAISNLPLNKLDQDGALRTRGMAIALDPTRDELIAYLGKLIKKLKPDSDVVLTDQDRDNVFDMIKNSTRASGLSIRTLVRAMEIYATMKDEGEPEDMIRRMVTRYA